MRRNGTKAFSVSQGDARAAARTNPDHVGVKLVEAADSDFAGLIAELDHPFSPAARTALDAGLESARRGEISPLDPRWPEPLEMVLASHEGRQ